MPPVPKTPAQQLADWARQARTRPTVTAFPAATKVSARVQTTFTNGVHILMNYQAVVWSSPGMADNLSAYPSRIYAPSSGLAIGSWRHNINVANLTTEIWANAGGVYGNGTLAAQFVNNGYDGGHFETQVSAGDYLEVFVYNSSGADVVAGYNDLYTFFSLRMA